MSINNSEKTGIKQLVSQFQEQQYNTNLQLLTLLMPTEPTKPIAIKLA